VTKNHPLTHPTYSLTQNVSKNRPLTRFAKIENPKKVLDISPDKPDNYFISLALEYSAIFITGDKGALKYVRDMKIDAKSAAEFLE